MSAPIRSAAAIQTIINNGQHAIGDLGIEIIAEIKTGVDNTDPDFRQLQYRIILIRIYLQNLLDNNGDLRAYYTDPLNEKKLNNLLTGVVKLSGLYGGPAIPKITGDGIPLTYYPSSATFINQNTTAAPGGVTFEKLNIDTPGEVIDRIDAASSTYAFYVMTVIGTGGGEGSRSTILLVTWRGTNDPVLTEYAGSDVGGVTTGVSFSAAYNAGYIELTCNVPTTNWIVRGSRISFYNTSFQNIAFQIPSGGAVGQLLQKASTQDYDLEFFTLLWSHITNSGVSLEELQTLIGISTGQTIQAQLDAEATARSGADTTLQGNIDTEATTRGNADIAEAAARAAADLLRVLKAGDTMSGNLAMGGNKVTGLAAGSANGEAVRYEQLPGNIPFTTSGGVLGAGVVYGTDFGFRKVDNKIELRGYLAGVVLAPDVTIFTLPVGYRPSQERIFTIFTFSLFSSVVQGITIGTDGTFQFRSSSFQNTYGTVLYFDGASFDLG